MHHPSIYVLTQFPYIQCMHYAFSNDSEEVVKLKDIKRAHDKANEPQVTHPLINKEASLSPTPPPDHRYTENTRKC